MLKIMIFLILNVFSGLILAQTTPLIIIEPDNPMEGDNIRIGVLELPCSQLPHENAQGFTSQIDIFENNITLYAAAVIPILPGGTVCAPQDYGYYELGTLEQGEFHLFVSLINQYTTFPFPLNYSPPPPYGAIIFSVAGSPQVIDTNNKTGLFLLIIMILSIFYIFRKNLKDTFNNIY